MTVEKLWPEVGEMLVHKFRRHPGEVLAKVVNVDRAKGIVTIEVEGKTYGSLTAGAIAVGQTQQNGWVFWGLKKQSPHK